eukprot:11545722-Karenia_brevis.AAC.1
MEVDSGSHIGRRKSDVRRSKSYARNIQEGSGDPDIMAHPDNEAYPMRTYVEANGESTELAIG